MDRFEAMRAFARVVETGSFTRAAHTLQISRTTVTQLVQQLEAHLRLRLLNRTTRRVSVTADGAAYYPRIARLLAELDEVEGGLGDAAAQPRGRLRVDVPGPYARLRLVPALPEFQARYPEIQLDIGVSDREVDVIADNVDCVIRGGTPADRFPRQPGLCAAFRCAGRSARAGRAGPPDGGFPQPAQWPCPRVHCTARR